jgi:SAM-dependent methyltransferase
MNLRYVPGAGGKAVDVDMTSLAEQFWEALYQGRDQLWGREPNTLLVDAVGSLPPGRALDLGCGEGADAVWLAQRGWKVTAVDASVTALRRASAHAAETGVETRINFQQLDLASAFPAGTFDLVSAQYLRSPIDFTREQVYRAAARAVAVGGLLLVVGRAVPPPWEPALGPPCRSAAETFAAFAVDPGQWRAERPTALTDNVVAFRRVGP